MGRAGLARWSVAGLLLVLFILQQYLLVSSSVRLVARLDAPEPRKRGCSCGLGDHAPALALLDPSEHAAICERLCALQGSCAGSRVLAMHVHSGSQGLGVQFASYAAALSASLRENMTLALDLAGAHWNYGRFDAYLNTSALCPGAAGSARVAAHHRVMLGTANVCAVDSENADALEALCDVRRVGRADGLALHSTLLRPAHDWPPRLGPRVWEALGVQLAFAPTDALYEEAAAVRAALERQHGLRWGEGVVGLHVRRGDRTDLHRFSAADYAKQVRTAAARLGTRAVYVAADGDAALAELGGASALGREFVLMTQPALGGRNASYVFSRDTPDAVTRSAMLDLLLLASAHVFVGAQRSMFGWLASRLMVGAERACPHWVAGDVSNAYGWWDGRAGAGNATCV